MGKIDIDYQKLHDAFFKYQTKPKMSEFGELWVLWPACAAPSAPFSAHASRLPHRYYEGKEYETKLKEKRPGDLSDELKEALSIPPLAPPPWLISMQRYGPPPSYPNLRIPGLNAPIPEGWVSLRHLVFALPLETDRLSRCLVLRGASTPEDGESHLSTSSDVLSTATFTVLCPMAPTASWVVGFFGCENASWLAVLP
jgi:hypothetical protein